MPNLFISHIESDFGSQLPIQNLSSSISSESFDMIQRGGYEFYVKESRDIYDVCRLVSEKVLDTIDFNRDEITDIIYLSVTKFSDQVAQLGPILSGLANNLGLNNARICAMSASGCSGFSQALRFCEQIIREQANNKILVLFAEKLLTDEERIPNDRGLLSDGVAACLITGEKTRNSYEVIARSVATEHRVTKADIEQNSLDRLKYIAVTLRELSADIWSKAGVTKASMRSVIVNNMPMSLLRIYCTELGFGMDKLSFPTLPIRAHVFSMDNLLNLKETSASDGDLLFCLSCGFFVWGAYIVKFHV